MSKRTRRLRLGGEARNQPTRSQRHAQDHYVSDVRQPGRRRGEPVHVRVQELEDRQLHALWRRGARPQGEPDDGDHLAGRAGADALNGGPSFSFTQGISLFVTCETQEELDGYWEKLTAGGKEVQCGWLVDRFGVSWQIVPSILIKLLGDKDRQKAGRVMQAMMKMIKLDFRGLQQAAEG
jgi:hypothetical protein